MKILAKKVLSDYQGIRVVQMDIHAPAIARSARPGQFVALMAAEEGERVPLTVVKTDPAKGIITLIFQEAGFTTRLLGTKEPGQSLYAIVGPLGHATHIPQGASVIIVGGGVGIAEICPVAQAMKQAGNKVTTILGGRTKELLILERELRECSDDFHVLTDDGSYGRRGFTTDALTELLAKGTYDLVYAVGPLPMMKRVAMVTKSAGVKTIVSLNALMVDATGMCGCCRVTVGGEIKFSCVDGPEFEANAIDWAELEKRNKVYAEQEKHICTLAQALKR